MRQLSHPPRHHQDCSTSQRDSGSITTTPTTHSIPRYRLSTYQNNHHQILQSSSIIQSNATSQWTTAQERQRSSTNGHRSNMERKRQRKRKEGPSQRKRKVNIQRKRIQQHLPLQQQRKRKRLWSHRSRKSIQRFTKREPPARQVITSQRKRKGQHHSMLQMWPTRSHCQEL